MGRQITQDEIDKLAIWNATPGRKYVSVEAYQDLLDWHSNPAELSEEDKNAIFGDIARVADGEPYGLEP